ncbi:hypothetical protein [Pseudothauera rhizosphaerae]|uniref:Uncharacterized protein n=1 Tax=Pseudothauera rhizosphaerae TaxID=2565932 RepID=A0A4S4AZY2_9RHOO|nr:hypothetical protein [Pseudothauera rhizosphaerae]THF64175.1 hypothetical protein E6O51_02290 [Pseudothauera rhizosphaerae]
MRPGTATALLAGLLFLSTASAQGDRPIYIQFNKATDEIHTILRKTPKPAPKDMMQISNIACNALRMLLEKEPRFKADIEALAAAGIENQAHHRRLADDVLFFLDSFIEEEHHYLVQSGISPDSSADILIAAALVRSALREPPSANTVYADILKLRDEVCRVARAVTESEADKDAYEARKRTIKRWALGLGGVSLITADALFAVPSGGTASASFAVGGASVGAAISQ